METLRSILRDITLVVYTAAGVLLCVVLVKGFKIEDLVPPIAGQVNTALVSINGKCGPDGCGTLALVNKTIVKTSDAIVTTQIQEQAIGKKIGTTMDALGTIPGHVNTTLDGLTQTEGAATQSLRTLTAGTNTSLAGLNTTLADTDTFIKNFGPTQTALQKSITDFNTLVDDPAIPRTIANFQTISGNFGATTADFQTKFHAFLFPPPCKTFGCKLAKTWPYIKGATDMVEPLYWGQQLFQAVHP